MRAVERAPAARGGHERHACAHGLICLSRGHFPAGDVHFIVKRNTRDDHGVCEGREGVQRHNTWGIAIARTVFAKTSFANHAASRPPMPDMVAMQRSGVK